jgi:DNA-binding transcriptional MocR family regulator
VLPSALAERVEAAATATYITPALLSQATIYEFLRRGSFEPNLERVCQLLRARRDAMLSALERNLPEATWSVPEGGYFVWVELPPGIGAEELLERAAEVDVTFVKGADFFPTRSGLGAGSLRLAFSFVSPDEIGEGMARLGALVAGAATASV